MMAAIAAALAMPGGVGVQQAALRDIGPYTSRGHGGKARPHHHSARYVAQDKRDARKRRNRLRAKGKR